MQITDSVVRGVLATASHLLPAGDQPVSAREMDEARMAAARRLHPYEHDTWGRLSREALRMMPPRPDRATRADLVRQMRETARLGLDLARLPGLTRRQAGALVWDHGAYTVIRVTKELRPPRGLSYSGRPWVLLWTDDPTRYDSIVLHAEFAEDGA